MTTFSRRKTILAAALSGLLALSATPVMTPIAYAEEMPVLTDQGEGDSFVLIAQQDTTYVVGNKDQLVTALNNQASLIFLNKDITVDDQMLQVNGPLTLDLNGFTLNLSGLNGYSSGISTNSNLNIVNSKSTGGIVSNINLVSEPVIYVTSDGTLTINNDNVTIRAAINQNIARSETGSDGKISISAGNYDSNNPFDPIDKKNILTGGYYTSSVEGFFDSNIYEQKQTDDGRYYLVKKNGLKVDAIKDQYWNGSPIEPVNDIVVRDTNGNVISRDKYDIAYENNTNVGTATILVTNKTDPSDRVYAKFNILPRRILLAANPRNASKYVNESDPTFYVTSHSVASYASYGLVSGHVVTGYTAARESGTSTGRYSVNVIGTNGKILSGTTDVTANYIIDYSNTSFTIYPSSSPVPSSSSKSSSSSSSSSRSSSSSSGSRSSSSSSSSSSRATSTVTSTTTTSTRAATAATSDRSATSILFVGLGAAFLAANLMLRMRKNQEQ